MKGWRTVLSGLVLAVTPAFLTYVAGINWTSLGIHPGLAAVIGAVIVGLRAITNTSIGSKE